MTLEHAIESLRCGKFILLYDSKERENEIDMVVAAQMAEPEHIARMRQHGGGLICLALDGQFGKNLGLKYMHDMLKDSLDPKLHKMIPNRSPYGDRPSFSIHVNHRHTYTGITDSDRALTAREIASLYGKTNLKEKFVSSFVTPGHLPLLLASKGMLTERRGHTEMSVYLLKVAGLSPVSIICEMMDAQTYTALSFDKASKYAKQNDIPFVDGAELLEHAKV
ncbi:MAG: 3,4-dihydroxy-2-butanone-4-phosphate synthase [Cenarchaeum symbiont of Oopsacas minuta]|nr:3,4-dihydroxy-2-butanone-4-phosphate synthase [Cenarchaeum symbiont of Oopsacas minuta]